MSILLRLSKQPDTTPLDDSLLWRFNLAGKRNVYLVLHVKFPIFCPILAKVGISLQVAMEVHNIKFTEICQGGQMTKVTGAFCDHANAPQNHSF
jgi:hypothetical protein